VFNTDLLARAGLHEQLDHKIVLMTTECNLVGCLIGAGKTIAVLLYLVNFSELATV